MIRLADIVIARGQAFREEYASTLWPSQYKALNAIENCRTSEMGGGIYQCGQCETTHYRYHSCRNRHCPQCQYQAGENWLQKQQERLLPTHYFMLTFTLPDPLRRIALGNQKELYSLLFRCAAEATQQLAQDARRIGGEIGMIGVLHTWGRNLSYHPHVHFLVPGGGLTSTKKWCKTSQNFFLPVKALSILFRAKMRDALKKTPHFDQIPADVWSKPWVVHSQAAGKGDHALKYLAPYIFRVAISDRRITRFADGHVTFRYRKSDTGQWCTCRLGVFEFLRRFLLHVLPTGFVKIRYYGIFSPGKRSTLAHCLRLLAVNVEGDNETGKHQEDMSKSEPYQPICPICQMPLFFVRRLNAKVYAPP
jgi:hypothetical protein